MPKYNYTKELTFRAVNLGRDATLVLTFDQKVDGLFTDKYPVVWKTIKLPKIGISTTNVTYRNELGFIKPEVRSDVIERSDVYQFLPPSAKTLLVKKDGRFSFTNPEPGSVGYEVVNDTDQDADMALGFTEDLHPDQPLTPVYYWNADTFEPDTSIKTQFSPILRAYITTEYEDHEIIRAPISVPLIFEKDLLKLDDSTVWIVYYSPVTGQFKINPGIF